MVGAPLHPTYSKHAYIIIRYRLNAEIKELMDVYTRVKSFSISIVGDAIFLNRRRFFLQEPGFVKMYRRNSAIFSYRH